MEVLVAPSFSVTAHSLIMKLNSHRIGEIACSWVVKEIQLHAPDKTLSAEVNDLAEEKYCQDYIDKSRRISYRLDVPLKEYGMFLYQMFEAANLKVKLHSPLGELDPDRLGEIAYLWVRDELIRTALRIGSKKGKTGLPYKLRCAGSYLGRAEKTAGSLGVSLEEYLAFLTQTLKDIGLNDCAKAIKQLVINQT